MITGRGYRASPNLNRFAKSFFLLILLLIDCLLNIVNLTMFYLSIIRSFIWPRCSFHQGLWSCDGENEWIPFNRTVVFARQISKYLMRVLVLLCFCQLEWYHISWWWHLNTFNKLMHFYILSPRDSQVKIFIKVVQTTVWHFYLHLIFKKKSCSLFNPRKNPSFRIPGPLRNACLGLDLKGRQMTLCCQSPYQHCAKSRCCCQQGLWPDQLPAMRHILFLRDLYWWMNYHQWQPKVDQADLQMTEDVQNLSAWPQAFPSNLLMDQQLQGTDGEYDLVWTSTPVILCSFKGALSNFHQCQI